ncbi:ABC transporter ATP-binding protein [Paraeggerthella hongkongensis]|uniref:ABC transporter ATP-binding protein n=1 Tax=Paraeggerthella TaxID=651554 RepID=UPI0015F0E72C|nr:ABC transporter ATP-binding protein [Paraeggerthella sp. Marseille-Q4926]MBU5405014.1 ABC transporter ATP-binding protein [Paraeggerthella hongkongensis]MCD2432895.1 ABC transporter ATP-binding protein [Paraeggerthella hominis]MDY3980503.1 ABC transporter ATP-binding protein [Paraeggerthella sp.]
MIRAKSVAFCYAGGSPLFQDVSFEVPAGSVLAVLGSNGVGKTTLLRCLMRFLSPTEGEFFLGDRPVRDVSAADFWKEISYVPQARSMVFSHTVLDLVVMGRSSYVAFGRTPSKNDYLRAEGLLESMGIASLARRSCHQLSGGQLQMVLIARALVKEPSVLIMDEPESNLDMRNQIHVLDLVERLASKDGLSIVMNTHYPAHALRVADQALLIGREGHACGPVKDMLNRRSISQYYGVDAQLLSCVEDGRAYDAVIPLRRT